MKKLPKISIFNVLPIVTIVLLIVWQTPRIKASLLSAEKAPPIPDSWIVTKVSDGDTITVRQTDGREMKVRFCGIDADETAKQGKPAQSIYADQAKNYLQELITSSNNKVLITVVDKDQYNRTVGEVWVNPGTDKEELASGLLVLKGLARVYTKYADKCPNVQALKHSEERAVSDRSGLWSDPNSIPAWEWRKQRKGK
jgi:micrococcal nuclease